MVASAPASIVYEKGGAIYVASNSGAGSRQLALGKKPQLSPDGVTVIYISADNKIFRVPAVGGMSTQIAPDLTCENCAFEFAEDSSSLVSLSSGIRRVPLDGSASAYVARGDTWGQSLSPDGKKVAFATGTLDDCGDDDKVCEGNPFIAVVPVADGTPRQITDYGLFPIWTRRGIVFSDDFPLKGTESESRIFRVNANGKARKLLRRNRYKSLNDLGSEAPYFRAGPDVLTAEFGRKRKVTYRIVSTASGRVLARRAFDDRRLKTFSVNGRTAYTISRSGRLQSVNLKTGKRRTLISRGVVDVNAGNTRF